MKGFRLQAMGEPEFYQKVEDYLALIIPQ